MNYTAAHPDYKKWVKNALKIWGKSIGYITVAQYSDTGRFYLVDKLYNAIDAPTLDLDWWRSMPIQDNEGYLDALLALHGYPDMRSEEVNDEDVADITIDIIHNASIPQRLAALYEASHAN